MNSPNVLMILLDGCRADRLGCYGYQKKSISKNIDRLANEGIIASNHYSTSNCTMPSVVSMMTGYYPSVHKASSTFAFYDGSFPYLTEILKGAGYFTFGISNNIVSMSPEWGFVRGYDKYYRIGKNQNWFKESKEEQRGVKKAPLKIRLKRMILKWIKVFTPFLAKAIEKRAQLNYYENNDMGGRKAVEALKTAIKDRDKSKPFFGFINLPDTHHPYFVPRSTSTEVSRNDISEDILTLNLNPNRFNFEDRKLSEQDKKTLSALYDECVKYSDELVGQILDNLKANQIMDNTYVIFCSDHGGMLCEKGVLFASTTYTYNQEVKVPFVIWGKDLPKKKITELTSAIDIFPTVLELCKVPVPNNIHGKSILSDSPGHSEVLIDYPCYPQWAIDHIRGTDRIVIGLSSKVNRSMVTSEGFKLIWTSSSPPECYDLKDDNQEEKNIFDEHGPLLVKRMKKTYQFYTGDEDPFLYYNFNDIGQNGSKIKLKNPSMNNEIIIIS